MSKADEDTPDDGSITLPNGTVIAAAEVQAILAAVGDADWTVLTGKLTPEIIQAFKDAGYNELAELNFEGEERAALLDVLDKSALEYSQTRSAELVTQIDDTTRERLRGTVEDALEEGWAKPELSEELQQNFAFSEYRADLIAHTELAMAHSYGRVDVVKAAGATKKKWLLSADHDPDEDCWCSEAADAGWVDMDDEFVPGEDDYDYPPGHPGCWCDWASDLSGEADEEDGSDDGDGDSSEADADSGDGDTGGEADDDAGKADATQDLTKWNEDQPRAANGQFGSGGESFREVQIAPLDTAAAEQERDKITPIAALSTAEQSALYKYGSNSRAINTALRQDRPLSAVQQGIRDQIDGVLARSQLPENTMLYRGVGEWGAVFGVKDESELVGRVFTDKAYVSTSLDKQFAVGMGATYKDGLRTSEHTVIAIRAPAGMPAVAMPRFAREKEVLLGRGSTFTVASVEHASFARGSQTIAYRQITVEPILQKVAGAATGPPRVRRSADFDTTGHYDVEYGAERYHIYRDLASGYWLLSHPPGMTAEVRKTVAEPHRAYDRGQLLGFSRKEALDEIVSRVASADVLMQAWRVDTFAKLAVDDAAHEAATSTRYAGDTPSDAQLHAGNYRMGHINVGGLDITIENPAGSRRRPQWPAMAAHYGYVKRTEGADGDHVDCFVKTGTDDTWQGTVYIVDQPHKDNSFDEHKCMLGYDNIVEATQDYLSAYQDGWILGPVTALSWSQFLDWLANGDTTTPLHKGDDAGHEFHGNQYTGGIGGGEKPTQAKAKGAKGGVHELLSSGHSFTFAELQHATGANASTLKTALSDLKSDKYAGPHGALNIVKNPDGTYAVKPGGDAKPEGMGKPEGAGKPVAAAKPEAAPVKMDVAAANKIYDEHIKGALAALKATAGSQQALQNFKESKAQGMANWKANINGTKPEPIAPQKVFTADHYLHAELKSGVKSDTAYSNWKTNTAAEKAGKPMTAGTLPTAAATNTVSIGKPVGTGKPVGAAQPVPSGKAQEGIPKAVMPDGYRQVAAQDFAPKTGSSESQFSTGINHTGSLLQQGSKDAVGNKISVQQQLTSELKDSPNWQALKDALGHDDLEAKLVNTWAATSGDNNSTAVAMQLAARDVFGMKNEDLSFKALGALHNAGSEDAVMSAAAANLRGDFFQPPPSPALVRAGLQEYVAGMYRNTQAYLASKGITDLYVARGMKVGSVAGAAVRDVALQPISSFSTDLQTAAHFGSGGSTFIARIPASQVLSTYMTGFGCSNEHEVTVLAHAGLKAVRLGSKNVSPYSPTTTSQFIHGHLVTTKDKL